MMDNTALMLFQGVEEDILNKINKFTKLTTHKKGKILFPDNELLHYFYVVKKGKIKNYQLNLNNAKEQTLFIYRDNDMFDTMILLDGKRHDVMYEVLEESILLAFPLDDIRELLSTHPVFQQRLFSYISKQMHHMEELATDISLYSTAERLIKLIIQNRDRSSVFKFNIFEGLSHSESAKLLGTVRHVLERHLKMLCNDKLIDIKNKKIQILNTDKLLAKIKMFDMLPA